MGVEKNLKFKKEFLNVLNFYKKSNILKNSPDKIVNMTHDIIYEMYPKDKKKRLCIYKDLCYSVYKIKMNGALVIILDTMDKKVIKQYFLNHELPNPLLNNVKIFHKKLNESNENNIKDYYERNSIPDIFYQSVKKILNINISKNINNDVLLKILINSIIKKANIKSCNPIRNKNISIIGNGNGKIININSFLNKLNKKAFVRPQIKISKKKPKLTKFINK